MEGLFSITLSSTISENAVHPVKTIESICCDAFPYLENHPNLWWPYLFHHQGTYLKKTKVHSYIASKLVNDTVEPPQVLVHSDENHQQNTSDSISEGAACLTKLESQDKLNNVDLEKKHIKDS